MRLIESSKHGVASLKRCIMIARACSKIFYLKVYIVVLVVECSTGVDCVIESSRIRCLDCVIGLKNILQVVQLLCYGSLGSIRTQYVLKRSCKASDQWNIHPTLPEREKFSAARYFSPTSLISR